MTSIPLDAHQCSCGHPFDHDDTDKSLSSEEIRVQAEELYASYLAARAEQAASALMSAQADYARDPGDQQKSDRVASALDAAEAARSALAAQSVRVAEMKKALPPTAKRAAPIPAPVAQIMPPATHKAPGAKSGSKPLAPVRHARESIPVITTVAATVVAAPKKKIKPPAQAEKKKPLVLLPLRKTVPEKTVVTQPAQTSSPNPAFRQAQAAKAKKFLSALQAAKPAPAPKQDIPPAKPVVEKNISQHFAIPANNKEAPRLYVEEKKQDCPNCTARVSKGATRCRCGYEFSCSEQHIPAVSMSDEERAEFAKLFSYP